MNPKRPVKTKTWPESRNDQWAGRKSGLPPAAEPGKEEIPQQGTNNEIQLLHSRPVWCTRALTKINGASECPQAALSTFLPRTAASRFGPMPGEKGTLPAPCSSYLGCSLSIPDAYPRRRGCVAVWGLQRRACAGCAVSWGGSAGLGKESSESHSCAGCWDEVFSGKDFKCPGHGSGTVNFGRGIQ